MNLGGGTKTFYLHDDCHLLGENFSDPVFANGQQAWIFSLGFLVFAKELGKNTKNTKANRFLCSELEGYLIHTFKSIS